MNSILLITLVFFSRQIKAIPNNLGFVQATGNYINEQYINSHKIDQSLFTYSSTGDLEGHDISEAFKDRTKYWVAKDSSTNISTSAIFINFKKTISLEAFRYDTAYKTPNDEDRTFSGFPTKLNVYTSINNEPYKINTIFSGDAPTKKDYGDYAVFEFSEPIICDKIKLEFEKVTREIFWANNNENAAARQIILLGSISTDNLPFEKVSGYYNDEDFVNTNSIPTSSFTYNSPGDFDGHPISYAFDNKPGTYWVAQNENTDTSFAAITVEFNQVTTLDAILYDSAYVSSGESRTFYGFPLILNIYISSASTGQFTLDTVFSGTPKGSSWGRTQFVFKNPITCKRLKIEFAKITPDTFFSKKNCAVAGGFTFINGNNQRLPIKKADSSYSQSTYLNSHKIPTTYFNYSSNGDSDNHPISYAFDDKFGPNTKYWVSREPNTDSFHSTIDIKFVRPVSLYSILIDTAYITDKENDKKRYFCGYPTILKIHASTNSQALELKATFAGEAPTETSFGGKAQFTFKDKIECDRLQIEFVEVTEDKAFSNSAKKAVANEIHFIGSFIPDQLSIHEVKGIFDDPSFVDQIKLSGDFKKSSTGDKAGHPLSNAFDNDHNSYWVSDKENTDDFRSSITVEFNKPENIDGFLLDSAYRTRGTVRYFDGYPIALSVFASSDSSSQLMPEAVFTGEPFFPWTRTQFIFKSTIQCKRIKLEFTDVTPDESFSNSKKCAAIADIIFLKQPFSLPLPDDSGDIYVEPNSCNKVYRCDVNNTENKQVKIDIQQSSFNNYQNNNDGGALSFVNCGATIKDDTFTSCSSIKGGGAIFYQNKLDLENDFILKSITFTDCHATFGGSAYVYSQSANVEIAYCTFVRSNLDPADPSAGAFTGGSALFLTMLKGRTSGLKFDNCGDKVVKIYNSFNGITSSLTLLDNQNSILIKNCLFKLSNKAKSAIYYVRGNSHSTFTINDCTFIGELAKGGHFIDGKYDSGNAPKLIVSSCRFSSASKGALNLDPNNDYLSVDLNDQIFNYQYSEIKERSQVPWKIIVIAAVPAALVVIAIIVAIVLMKKRKNPNIIDETEMVAENNDLTEREALNQALI